MDHLDVLPLFLAVAEDRSFTRAAQRLGLSRSAAGKAVTRLEARMGVALFQRTTRSVRLTESGEILFERARKIRGEWQAAEALIAQARAEPRGRLRVALPAVGHRLLAPHLPAFRARYPLVSLDLDQDDSFRDLTAAGIDVAIRSGALDDASHRSRPLTDFAFLLCAAPTYFAGRPTLQTYGDLALHSQIRFRFAGSERLQPWRLANVDDASSGTPALVSTNMEGVLAATRAGLGIGQMPDFLAGDDLAAGRLVEVLPEMRRNDRFWLVWPQHLHRTPNVRAFVHNMANRFRRASTKR